MADDDKFTRRILVTGGAGFMCVDTQSLRVQTCQARPHSRARLTHPLACSASHVVILLAKKYPHYFIVNFDRLDYCSSLKNLASVANLPNYAFVRVSFLIWSVAATADALLCAAAAAAAVLCATAGDDKSHPCLRETQSFRMS